MNEIFFSHIGKNEHIQEYLEKNLAKYRDINYAFMVMSKWDINDITIISDMPDYFSDIYLGNKYQSVDPILLNALNRVSPLAWDENMMINNQSKFEEVFLSVKPYYNIISGQTFVLHDQNNHLAVLSLYINKYLMADIYEDVTKHKDALQGLLINAHEMLLYLYREEKDNKSTINCKKLSSREAEILYWSSIGKTYSEIAFILGIKSPTVKFHMGNIVRKLGVSNAKHAIRHFLMEHRTVF
ncbi:LuxR family transcriptional regulator [Rahnella sp. SAP-1]|uniref:LuxR family transcriptional regulator n=1 Tax=Rouxiella aceris TaxID=2703884 RepID=A0A848MLS5_9GAMM|nr:LuxR family transcriptional regulator [Rouxiella aceris]NMP29357.1 LuxR family transcriptional regulator [Rouxiella aceris]